MFEFSMVPTINKPTRVTKYTATAIDNIITNCIINSDFKSAIVKTDLSDHFPIIFINFIRVYTSPYPYGWYGKMCIQARFYWKHI